MWVVRKKPFWSIPFWSCVHSATATILDETKSHPHTGWSYFSQKHPNRISLPCAKQQRGEKVKIVQLWQHSERRQIPCRRGGGWCFFLSHSERFPRTYRTMWRKCRLSASKTFYHFDPIRTTQNTFCGQGPVEKDWQSDLKTSLESTPKQTPCFMKRKFLLCTDRMKARQRVPLLEGNNKTQTKTNHGNYFCSLTRLEHLSSPYQLYNSKLHSSHAACCSVFAFFSANMKNNLSNSCKKNVFSSWAFSFPLQERKNEWKEENKKDGLFCHFRRKNSSTCKGRRVEIGRKNEEAARKSATYSASRFLPKYQS